MSVFGVEEENAKTWPMKEKSKKIWNLGPPTPWQCYVKFKLKWYVYSENNNTMMRSKRSIEGRLKSTMIETIVNIIIKQDRIKRYHHTSTRYI